MQKCPDCKGEGSIALFMSVSECTACGGSGEVSTGAVVVGEEKHSLLYAQVVSPYSEAETDRLLAEQVYMAATRFITPMQDIHEWVNDYDAARGEMRNYEAECAGSIREDRGRPWRGEILALPQGVKFGLDPKRPFSTSQFLSTPHKNPSNLRDLFADSKFVDAGDIFIGAGDIARASRYDTAKESEVACRVYGGDYMLLDPAKEPAPDVQFNATGVFTLEEPEKAPVITFCNHLDIETEALALRWEDFDLVAIAVAGKSTLTVSASGLDWQGSLVNHAAKYLFEGAFRYFGLKPGCEYAFILTGLGFAGERTYYGDSCEEEKKGITLQYKLRQLTEV